MNRFFITCLLLSSWACTDKHKAPREIQQIEVAHQRADFLNQQAVQFKLRLYFGKAERLNGLLTLTTDSRKGRLELENGARIYYSDDKVYHSAGLEGSAATRFDAYTWAYFFLFPYKLSDEGTQWAERSIDALAGETYYRQKLTFSPGTGDAADDWYIVYTDTSTHRIEIAAYIVTASKSLAEASKDPHAIEYLNYKEVEGIPIAHNWRFWRWRENEGLSKQLGYAELSDFKFIRPKSDFFSLSPDLMETK